MSLPAHHASRIRCSSWRAILSIGLTAAYFVLAGETIHCQYFPSAHEHHGGAPSRPAAHATHCLLANHGTSLAIHSVESTSQHRLRVVGLIVNPGHTISDTGFVPSTPARAPPSA